MINVHTLCLCLWVFSYFPTTTQGQQPADYCVPEAWQGGRAVTTGTVSRSRESSVKRSHANIVYSAKQHKVLIDEGMYEGRFVRRIYDYPGKVLYTITGIVHQTCNRTALPGPFVPYCVPGNATVILTNSRYGIDTNMVPTMELTWTHNNVNHRVSLTYNTHVPIYEQHWGDNSGENFFRTMSFYNLTISTDIPPSLFKPPAFCQHAPLIQARNQPREDLDSSLRMMQ